MRKRLLIAITMFTILVSVSFNFHMVESLDQIENKIIEVVNAPVKIISVAEAKPVMASPKVRTGGKELDPKEVQCLSENIYFEAGSQSYAGKLAVAQVTLNRMKAPGYPKTICEVVYEGSKNPNLSGCQFSWTCDPNHPRQVKEESFAWRQSHDVAITALSSPRFDITDGATHFHTVQIKSPGWNLTKVAQIDDHIFYK